MAEQPHFSKTLSPTRQRRLSWRRFNLFLRDRNLRFTTQRQAVLGAVLQDGGHFEAETLAARLHGQRPRVSRATVYRTLELMRECHLLEKLDLEAQGTFYELTLPGEHHDHLICIQCGSLLEFYEPRLEAIQQEVCARLHFRETHHSLRIFGICKACAALSAS